MADKTQKKNNKDDSAYDDSEFDSNDSDVGGVGGRASGGEDYSDTEESGYTTDDFYSDDETSS